MNNMCNENRNEHNNKKKKLYIYNLNVIKECKYMSKSVDLNLDCNSDEKCVDIQMDKYKYIRIFGEIQDSKGNGINNTKVTLFKTKLVNYKTEYIPICDMVTDEKGQYEAVLEEDHLDNHYMIEVLE